MKRNVFKLNEPSRLFASFSRSRGRSAQSKKRIRVLEERSPQVIVSSQTTWVCTVHGLDKDYSEPGSTHLIASMEATKKCRKHDRNNGFFCGEPTCAQ